jgi:hypothetical protein
LLEKKKKNPHFYVLYITDQPTNQLIKIYITMTSPITITQVTGGTPVAGVSLNYISQFIQTNLSTIKTTSPQATMTDLVQQIIKPQTQNRTESYAEYLAREQPSTVKSTADYFVSYVWAYPLKELLKQNKH